MEEKLGTLLFCLERGSTRRKKKQKTKQNKVCGIYDSIIILGKLKKKKNWFTLSNTVM